MDWVATFLTAPAIMAVVNLLKKYGLSSDWAPAVSLVVGAIFGVLVWFLMGMGPVTVLTHFIVAGVAAGLTASGLYDASVTVGENKQGTIIYNDVPPVSGNEYVGERYSQE